jgi:hypothetical protein
MCNILISEVFHFIGPKNDTIIIPRIICCLLGVGTVVSALSDFLKPELAYRFCDGSHSTPFSIIHYQKYTLGV